MNWTYRVRSIAAVALLPTLLSCMPFGQTAPESAADAGAIAVADAELGLSKTSVLDAPDPIVATQLAVQPGASQPQEGYFSGSPPLIPHTIEGMLPITASQNLCLACHDLPDQIGREIAPGNPTPMPASHYTDLRRDPTNVTQNVIGARFNCNQCHAAQTDAEPLVTNTYGQ
jgi:cytochrome c-type protein NapB